jgi:sugar phosphate permease
VDAPLPILIAVLLVAGVLGLAWNGLAFTAAAEMAGHARAGMAIGLQGTVIRIVSAGAGVMFGLAVEKSGSWSVAFLLLALLPLASFGLLTPLSKEEERRLLPHTMRGAASLPQS